ncbi:MAG: tail fiber domain-containing protein [Acidobacteria bacterium]|nr:tail fiber domain-containing protein [Acidobacteriota bacterium]
MFNRARTIFVLSFFLLATFDVIGQSTSFNYQGELKFNGQPANGNFDLEFLLFDAASGGTQIGTTAARSNVAVADGRFTVSLDFGAIFTGPERFLEIRVRQAGGGGFTILDPRQRIGSSPYAVRSVSAGTADTATTATNATNAVNATNATTAATATNALNLGGVAANQYVLTTDPRMSDPRTPTAGSNSYIQNTTVEQSPANFNILGDGRARNLEAINTFRINGNRAFAVPGSQNLFVGIGAGPAGAPGSANTFVGNLAGNSNTTGTSNSFLGSESGRNNTTGTSGAYFGYNSGASNTTGNDNSFFGAGSGSNNTTGNRNSFVGTASGQANTVGSNNSHFGYFAGFQNIGAGNSIFGSTAALNLTNGLSNSFFGYEAALTMTTGNENSYFGSFAGKNASTGTRNSFFGHAAGFGRSGDNLTLIGSFAQTTVDGLTFATAIGSNATVSSNNTIALGRSGGEDTVLIPGPLQAAGNLTAAMVNAGSQFNIGGNRILGNPGTANLFAGIGSGSVNAGVNNSFFGSMSGNANTSGDRNSFFGASSGQNNSTGIQNTFIGDEAGFNNTTGGANTFLGAQTGSNNSTGNNNTLLGNSTNVASGNLSYATAIGAGATASASNIIVLGRSGGQDLVSIPGTTRANVVETFTHFSIGSNRVLSTPGAFTVFAGSGAGRIGSLYTGSRNSFFGAQAGNQIENGTDNSLFGAFSGFELVSGSFNTFIGDDAGRQTTSGNRNTFVGDTAGTANFSGSDNVILGASSGGGNLTGVYNTYVGSFAASSASSGDRNTFIGGAAGGATSAGSKNTLLGFDSSVSNSLSYATAIGAESTVSTSNTIALGRSNGSDTVKIYGRLRLGTFGSASATTLCYTVATLEVTTCSSSIRYKENISDYRSGMDLIRRLRPVYFDWKHNGVRDFGLVAEEVAAVEPLLATTNKDGEIQGVNYERIGVVLVNAVNEQQSEIERLKADSENKSRQIEELLEANRRQQAQIEALTKLFCSANPAAGICRERP